MEAGGRFFSEVLGDDGSDPIDTSSSGKRIDVPEGWDTVSLFSRIYEEGLCTYLDVKECRVDVKDVFKFIRIIKWRDYVKAQCEAEK